MKKSFHNPKIFLLVLVCLLIANALQAQLKAVFTVDTISGCAPFSVKIREASTGNPTQYFWDFGNGQTSTLRTPIVIYTKPGTYTLTETVTSGTTQSSTFATLYVRGVPATFTYDYTDVCKTPATINFFADSVDNITKYHWNFGDNNKSIASSPANTYTIDGKYAVQLITVSSQGCQDTSVQQIQIGKGDADFQLPSIACVGQPISLTNASLPIPKTTVWTIDNTTVTGTDASYTFNKEGRYNIKMDADFGSCNQTVNKQVNVLLSPKAAYNEAGTLVSCSYPVTVTFTNTSANAASYKWLFGDGETATTQNATHTFSKAGMFNVSLVAFNANGCSDTLTKASLVKLGPPVINGFINLPVSGCIPVTAKPKANIISPEEIVSYDWDFGDGQHASVAEPTHIYTTAGYYRITLTVKTTSGCSGTYSMFQAAAGGAFPPVADFSVPDTNVCGSNAVKFTASAAGTVTSWNWDFGDGSKSTIQNPSHQYAAPGNYTVTLYVSDKGCPANVQKKNYLLVKPPFAKLQPVYYCDDRLKVDFKDKSIQPLTWNWDFGDGNSSTSQNTTHTYSKSGEYHVKLTTTNDGCTSITDTVVSVIDFKPKVTLLPANGAICRSDSLSINTDNTDFISDYLWKLGDGTTIFGNSDIKYAYKKNGTYTPYLIVNYINGCKDTSALDQNINVYGPTAGFTVPATVCLRNVINFADASYTDGIHAIQSWQWNNGDGGNNLQTTAAYSHVYSAGGTYIASLKVTDAFGCTDSMSMPIVVKGASAAFDFEENKSTCDSAIYNFADQSSMQDNDAIVQYKWNFGDGESAFVKNPSHSYTQDLAKGLVSLAVSTASGCADTSIKSIQVTVPEAPEVVISVPKTVCLNEPVNFTATQNAGTSATNWLWTFGDNEISNEQNTTHTYTTPSVFEVRLIANTDVSCADTVTQRIAVNALPTVNAGEDVIICAGKAVNLTASGAETYIWQPGASLSCANCAAPVASPAATTQYYVTGTDINGCINSDTINIVVQQLQQVSVEKSAVTLCIGDSVTLAASGSDEYIWQPAATLSNPAIANPVANPSVNTIYTVTATDAMHCFTSSEQVTVSVVNKPSFDISDSLLTLSKGAVHQLLTSSSANVVNWLWQPQQGLSCYNCESPLLTANQDIAYTATATTIAGCSASDVVHIIILCNSSQLFMPSAFTPNNDGKNDRFYPLSVGSSSQKVKLFAIYSSTGQSVFSKQNIYTNTFADGWDGNYKSNLLGNSTFIYKIEIECEGKIVPLTGTVTVIR